MQVEYENRDICSECGGKCCKKSGCDYIPSDFSSMGFDYLYERLQKGDISIVSTIIFDELKDRRVVITPLLYLRARNIDRDIVDLVTLKKPCSQLKDDGCSYSLENRPSGGVNLIPYPNNKCRPLKDQKMMIKEWERYQKVLSRLVKRLSGLSVDAKMRLDIENLFFDVMTENFSGVSEEELIEVHDMLPLLIKACPDEYLKAYRRYHTNRCEKPKRLHK